MANNCFVLNSKGLFGFGSNLCGQLGFGMNIRCRCEPTLLMEDLDVKQIATGPHHTLMLKNNGELFVFGSNCKSQLGLGHNITFTYEPMLLMTDLEIKLICCGDCHSMVLKNNGELLVFGFNSKGRLGFGDCINEHVRIPTLLMKDSKIKSICCGAGHSMILKNNGEVFVFGLNRNGQLGLGNYQSKYEPTLLMTDLEIRSIHCGCNYSVILKNDGTVLVFGENKNGQLGKNEQNSIKSNKTSPRVLMKDPTITLISCGSTFLMILKNNGELLIYGNNSKEPRVLMNDSKIRSIFSGAEHAMILKNNDELFVFGENSYCQLGLGTHTGYNLDIPKLLMKDQNIEIFGDNATYLEWSCKNHNSFSKEFQQRIHTFLLFLKRNQMKTGLKIPKFVLFEIIKYVV